MIEFLKKHGETIGQLAADKADMLLLAREFPRAAKYYRLAADAFYQIGNQMQVDICTSRAVQCGEMCRQTCHSDRCRLACNPVVHETAYSE